VAARGGVEQKVVSRRDDHEQHEHGIEHAEDPQQRTAAEAQERGADDDA
jgi:hypothetical protein